MIHVYTYMYLNICCIHVRILYVSKYMLYTCTYMCTCIWFQCLTCKWMYYNSDSPVTRQIHQWLSNKNCTNGCPIAIDYYVNFVYTKTDPI